MGRLTRDPELRRTGSGIAVTSFTLAVDRDYADKQTKEKETDFIDVTAWRQTGEYAAKYFTKGRMAVVSGRLQIRKWTDKDGNKRYTAEVVAENVYFGDSKPSGQQPAQAGPAGGGYGYSAPAGGNGYAAPVNGNDYSAPQQAAQPNAGSYSGYDTPRSDFAMLDDDAQLPF